MLDTLKFVFIFVSDHTQMFVCLDVLQTIVRFYIPCHFYEIMNYLLITIYTYIEIQKTVIGELSVFLVGLKEVLMF